MCAQASLWAPFHSCLFEVYYLSQATKFRPPLPLMWMKLFALLALHACFYSHFSHSRRCCCWMQLNLLNYSLSKIKTQQPRRGWTLDRLQVKTIDAHDQFCAVFPPIWNQFYSSAPKGDSWHNTNSSWDCHHSHLHPFLKELFTDPNITSSLSF